MTTTSEEEHDKQSTVDEEVSDTLAPLRPAVQQRRRTPSDLRYMSDDLMGSIVRRRRVVSLPLGDRSFFGPMTGVPTTASTGGLAFGEIPPYSGQQPSPPITPDTGRPARKHQPSYPPRDVVRGILRRKQVSLDLLSPQQADFFGAMEREEEIRKHEEVIAEEEEEEEEEMKKLFFPLKFAPPMRGGKKEKAHGEVEEGRPPKEVEAPHVVRATRVDKIKALILCCLMIAFVGVCIGWETHEDESHSVFGLVGKACVTDCLGDREFRNFFVGNEDHFDSGDIIGLTMHLDPRPSEDNVFYHVRVDIARLDETTVGSFTQTVVKSIEFGPPEAHERKTIHEKVTVNWETPQNHHVINAYSETGVPLSFTLAATKQSPLSDKSVLIAALIMVFVYVFILLEVIHRTLVSIFGSMVALFFFFLMHNGETESIKTIMLHQEWSTLGLLFGMMVLVGELSHTGVFEWLAVRLLVSSKGSFNRLMVLLGLLTALASAFLDNVTTMLLLAPVTIDMCGILGVDPRPYLITEVIMSNIGGTATQIGDPPNIIIGSSFEEVGFVDFIVNVLPCIFLFAVPLSLMLLLWIFKPFMTMKEMPELDAEKLKLTYPIYDEPRLLIAGTSTFFLIILFFLHPLHHKDTAWLALITALLTISFTNPHDVQDVLRNHVEWDTLLFFAGLFVLVEVCAAMGLLEAIGEALADVIKAQSESQQLPIAITLIIWVSAITSAFLDNIPYTATMIPVVRILSDELPDTLPIKTLAWALSFGACLGGNGTLLGASANIVTAGISSNRGFKISFMNFFYPGMMAMILTTAISNLYMVIVYVWVG
mmetsp:Transcript_6013/g.11396  ORF Transcript_6013/g.11396 Transcript_6013/m.11396 type:complete len:821 (+) Transcript_6013:255-2717(+)|eukprot:CAMPEP_0176492494 /NCGR_PEP_ID=MMETSP0200_2-20121128/9033_1 /TAXON_ID=947934 /ORGANISM="Chaetoceros sp., Strain GSL56" /LENGTH=820 /DNA_ID=CAMNT_0017890069 /DNA_START=216 /DNA_END=2678 /DNA_ORIENTATION=-